MTAVTQSASGSGEDWAKFRGLFEPLEKRFFAVGGNDRMGARQGAVVGHVKPGSG